MKFAICGYPPLASQVQQGLSNNGIEFKFFIGDFLSIRGGRDFYHRPSADKFL